MKSLYNVVVVLLFFVAATHCRKKKNKINITFPTRTVLQRADKKTTTYWYVSSSDGITITDPQTQQKQVIDIPNCCIAIKKNKLFLNGKKLNLTECCIAPIKGDLFFNNTKCTHGLRLSNQKKIVVAISYSQPQELIRSGWLECAKKHKDVQSYLQRRYRVRVLLDEQKILTKKNGWTIKTDNGFLIADLENTKKSQKLSKNELLLSVKNNQLYVNGKKYHNKQLYLRPQKGYLHFNGADYDGGFLITFYKGNVLLINSLALEDYVYSVIKSESWPGWPLEVNKVFAIMTRSYAIATVLNGAKNNKPYHIKNTNVHQMYGGVHECAMLKKAVEQTKGVFLSHKQKPVLAMFDSCCGGIIPAHVDGVDFNKAPYLERTYPCTYCKSCKLYSWQASYDLKTCEQVFKKRYKALKKIKQVKVAQKDKAGLVKHAAIKGLNFNGNITGKKLYSLFKDVKSFCFSIEQKANKIIFKGKGYGHHLGLCQWGARQMVRDGHDYKRVLQFYYPKTGFMRLG